MLRERVACAYPGVGSVGLSLWTVDDQTVRRVAMGSAPATTVTAVLARFDPDMLVIESGRKGGLSAGPFRATARDVEFVHPGWSDRRLRQPVGRVGPLAQNAWRMGFHHLVRRGPYRYGQVTASPLTPEWLEANGPPRRERGA